MVIAVFIILQIILFFFITLHDWVHIPPFTDIRELEKHSSKKERLINSGIFALFVAVPLALTWFYRFKLPLWVLITLVFMYGLLTIGTILSWWMPYLLGSSPAHKEAFAIFNNTHRFLPPRGDNVIPNTLHVILHIHIWICLGIALYLLITA